MKKIMFNNHYGLTKAVIKRIKNKTRRLAPIPEDIHVFRKLEIVENELRIWHAYDNSYTSVKLPYKVGEIVAIAQSYKDAGYSPDKVFYRSVPVVDGYKKELASEQAGWTNKMFVCANLMPHHIRITNVRVERLQDISDEDCIAEGVEVVESYCKTADGKKKSLNYYRVPIFCKSGRILFFSESTPQAAFAYLIDKISGKGTWQANPWVLAYTFELVK